MVRRKCQSHHITAGIEVFATVADGQRQVALCAQLHSGLSTSIATLDAQPFHATGQKAHQRNIAQIEAVRFAQLLPPPVDRAIHVGCIAVKFLLCNQVTIRFGRLKHHRVRANPADSLLLRE